MNWRASRHCRPHPQRKVDVALRYTFGWNVDPISITFLPDILSLVSTNHP